LPPCSFPNSASTISTPSVSRSCSIRNARYWTISIGRLIAITTIPVSGPLRCPINQLTGQPTYVWTDVTGSSQYSIVGTTLAWSTDPTEVYTCVRSNRSIYDLLLGIIDETPLKSFYNDAYPDGPKFIYSPLADVATTGTSEIEFDSNCFNRRDDAFIVFTKEEMQGFVDKMKGVLDFEPLVTA
jgi:hypothetical protein